MARFITLVNREQILNGAFLNLISKKRARGYGSNLVKVNELDMVMGVRVELDDGQVQLTKNHLAMWGILEEELISRAKSNMYQKFKAMSMSEFLNLPEDGAVNMWIITNQSTHYGAGMALCEGKMKELAEKLNSDLLVFPSSVHEMLAIKASDWPDIKSAKKIVVNINETEVDPDERLSENVYYCSRSTGKLKIARE